VSRHPADEQSLRGLSDRAAVSDVVLGFARSLDIKDWEACRRCFLDEIETDYSDLRGEPPSRVKADDFVAKRRAALERLKTLHLSTNHLVTVDGDRATCVSAAVIHRLLQWGGGYPPRARIFCAPTKPETKFSWHDTSGQAESESAWSGEGAPRPAGGVCRHAQRAGKRRRKSKSQPASAWST